MGIDVHNDLFICNPNRQYNTKLMTNYIIAGNAGEYMDYVKGKNPDDYRYVISPQLIVNTLNPHGKFIGSFRNRSDLKEIISAIVNNTDKLIHPDSEFGKLVIEIMGNRKALL